MSGFRPQRPRGRRPTHRAAGIAAGPWWVAAAAAALVMVTVGAVAAATGLSSRACAAMLPLAATTTGQATFYTLGSQGNCSYPAPADKLYVALPPSEYSAAGACGSYLQVTGPKGSVRVKVIDQCPECVSGHIDLSAEAFARIADPVKGIVAVTYRTLVDPPLPGPVTVRVKEGSSQWWLALRVDNTGNAVSSVSVSSGGGGWRNLRRTDYNYWLADAGAGKGPFRVRVTDTQGHTVVVDDVAIRPGQIVDSGTTMYGGVATSASSTKATTRATTRQSAMTSPGRTGSTSRTARNTSTSTVATSTVSPVATSSTLPLSTTEWSTTPSLDGSMPPAVTTTGRTC